MKISDGIIWNTIERIFLSLKSIIVLAVLARALTPSDFGTIAIVVVFTGLGNFIIESGFRNIIIGEKNITDLKLSTLFWYSIFVSCLLTILLLTFAKTIANFYDLQHLEKVLYIISPAFLLYALNLIPLSLYSKRMNFNLLAKRAVVSDLSAGLIAITMAFLGLGYWSLVIQALFKSIISNILLWYQLDWRPNFAFSIKYLKDTLKLSTAILTNGIMGYIVDNLDNFLIGKYFGTKMLGFYSKSYTIVNLPTINIRSVINKVVFPAMSIAYGKSEDISMYCSKAIKQIIMLVVPIMIPISIFANDFTLLLFGIKWIEQVPFIKLFAIGGIFYSINNLYIYPLVLISDSKSILISNILRRGSVVIAILIGLTLGIKELILLRVIAEVFNSFVCFYYIFIATGVSVYKQFMEIVPFIISGAVSLIIFEVVDFKNYINVNLLFDLIANSFCYVLSYLIVLFLLFRKCFEEYSLLFKNGILALSKFKFS